MNGVNAWEFQFNECAIKRKFCTHREATAIYFNSMNVRLKGKIVSTLSSGDIIFQFNECAIKRQIFAQATQIVLISIQ